MKKIILVTLLSLGFVIFQSSCERTFMSEEIPLNQEINLNKGSDNLYSNAELSAILSSSGVGVVCSGECSCHVWIDMETKQGGCTCDECVMDLTFKDNDLDKKMVNKSKLLNSLFSLPLYESALKDLIIYAKSKYKSDIKGFDKVEFIVKDSYNLITFHFTDASGNSQSVLYTSNVSHNPYQNTKSELVDRKFRVDCSGDCGCREQFDFNTNTASCSCSDCTMEVTEIQKDLR